MPPQPDGVWQTVYSGAKWKTAEGADRYRRAVYTYWRRTSPYPSMMMFDSPTRDLCSARRISTNTPLQALVTLNDPVFLECSDALARSAVQAYPRDVRRQIESIFSAVTQRDPTPQQLDALVSLFEDLVDEHEASEEQANNDLSSDESNDNRLSIVANTVLNLDWALTK